MKFLADMGISIFRESFQTNPIWIKDFKEMSIVET